MGFKVPDKKFMNQKVMLKVAYTLLPLVAFSVYLYGWRSLLLLILILAFGIGAEALFAFRQGKPISQAVFVTCLIYHLSLPPTIPYWMAVLGILFGVIFGKMVFGGFGMNVFNPAMVGRCFVYITFPLELTGRWTEPFWGGAGGLLAWSTPVDAISRATPLAVFREGGAVDWLGSILGRASGSLGEASALLIILGGAWLIHQKAASWRLAGSYLVGGALVGLGLFIGGAEGAPNPLLGLFSGSFLFGCAFIVTEPISGPKTKPGQLIYGFIIGAMIIALRVFSNFSEGVMFSVLIMNSFVPLLDDMVKNYTAKRKAA